MSKISKSCIRLTTHDVVVKYVVFIGKCRNHNINHILSMHYIGSLHVFLCDSPFCRNGRIESHELLP
ncbi:hypothetical protein HYC85_014369 [Camellia sinensis]|uniref:Uncharacterized protein n=1 Tax=Camellia sinensis TaxID=4442 RepID=A0A7J7H602_CAMSI|nr:hypothetical protein HYC85_014369 [Camellia sinensis]